MTSLLVCSNIRLYRDGLTRALAQEPGLEVAANAADGETALVLAARLQPDVILLDTSLPDSVALIRALVASLPEAKVLAVAVPEREAELIELAEAGVAGFVTRDESFGDLLRAIAFTARGEVACSSRTAAVLLRRVTALAAASVHRSGPGELTHREREVVALLDEGLSNKAIAQRLRIELPTVKNHVHSILEKLEVNGRGEAAERARLQGVI